MPTLETVSLLAFAAAGWLWFDSLRAREAAVRSARAACGTDGLLFLDDTVAIASLRPVRGEDGRLHLRRVYRFEYSDTGDNRRSGALVLIGCEVVVVQLGPPRLRAVH